MVDTATIEQAATGKGLQPSPALYVVPRKIMNRKFFLALLLSSVFHGFVLAEQPLNEALEDAKLQILKSNSTADLFLPAVTEFAFLSGLEYAVHDYDDLVLQRAEKAGKTPKEIDPHWYEIYRPIFVKILETKTLPTGVTIEEMKHIVWISSKSPNRIYCDQGAKYIRGLDLRLNVKKISDEALGFSIPILEYKLGHFHRE